MEMVRQLLVEEAACWEQPSDSWMATPVSLRRGQGPSDRRMGSALGSQGRMEIAKTFPCLCDHSLCHED